MIDWLDRRKSAKDRWRRLPLAYKFTIAGTAFTLIAMVLCSVLTTTFLTDIILERRGGVVSSIVQQILAPSVDDLARGESLDEEAIGRLDAVMRDPMFSAEFPYLDIWVADGSVVYSNTIGTSLGKLPLPAAVMAGFAGRTTTQFSDVDSEDHTLRDFRTDFIEIYFPLYEKDTNNIVAVAQIREVTTSLDQDLWTLTWSSWLTVAIISCVVMVGLFSVVLEGSRTIERQGRVLSKRLAHSHARAARHRELKAAALSASRSVTELTDKYLRTIGADLHDGPAQSISYAILKLDQLRRRANMSTRSVIVAEIEVILAGSLREIRSIATAMVLPEIADLTLCEVIDRAVDQHVERTGSIITVDNRVEQVHATPEVAVCVYRFIQEGLNNAFQHGIPDGQLVTAVLQAGVLKLSITNDNLSNGSSKHPGHPGIGLYGLRARVQSIGGKLVFIQEDGKTRLEMWLRHE